jgi:hypothetical protein
MCGGKLVDIANCVMVESKKQIMKTKTTLPTLPSISLEIIFTLFTSSYYLFRFGRIGIGG